MPVPLERWPELIWAQSALWVRRRRQTQNKSNEYMYTTNSSPTIESLQDWVWRVLGTSFDVKVLLWWIFLSKFHCAYIDEPACAHTSRFINSGVSNPADNGCNWTMVQQCNSSKILAKLLQQLLNRWLLHFHSRQVERFPNWQFIIKIETSLSPQTSWLGLIDTTVDLTLMMKEGGGTTRGKWWNQDDELASNVICEEA